MSIDLAEVRPMQYPAKDSDMVDAAGNGLSAWIDGKLSPLHPGPYQRRRMSDGKSLGYSRWTGTTWMYAAMHPGDADAFDAMASDYQVGGAFDWRGVAKAAKLH